MATARVVIVGAGPAGVRCAETLLAAGIKPILIGRNHAQAPHFFVADQRGLSQVILNDLNHAVPVQKISHQGRRHAQGWRRRDG